jgi:homoserine kinase
MTKIQSGIKVTAPVTVADLNLGYDIISVALDKIAVEIVIYKSEVPGLRIKSISGDKKQLNTEVNNNIAALSALNVWKHLKDNFSVESNIGIEIEIRIKIPFNSELGIFESLATAGAYAMNAFFGTPLEKKELVPIITFSASSLDLKLNYASVVSSLMGSCMLVRDIETYDFFRIPVPRGLFFTLLIPEKLNFYNTNNSTNELLKQTANLGSLIFAMYNTDLNLISRSLNSSLNNNLFFKIFPSFNDIKSTLYSKTLSFGSLRHSNILFILSPNSIIAEEIQHLTTELFNKNKVKFQSFISSVNYEGCEIR